MRIETPSTKSVVVFGATGFIGSNIVRALSKDEFFSVISFSSKDLDLTNYKQTKAVLPELLKPSVVIMAAALTRDKANNVEGMLHNIKMTANLASFLPPEHVSQVIYISTIDVYGRENLTLPLSELSELKPSDYYAISKLSGELILKKACVDNKIPIEILRLPGVYGPDDPHNSPIKIFINAIVNGDKIRVTGDGSQLRDFLFINDIAEIVCQICDKKANGIYNMVSGKSYRIIDVIEMVSKIYKKAANIIYEDSDNSSFDIVFSKSRITDIIPSFEFTELNVGINQMYNSDFGVNEQR